MLESEVASEYTVYLLFFIELFESNFLKPRPSLESAYMEVLISTEAEKADDQVTYLYK